MLKLTYTPENRLVSLFPGKFAGQSFINAFLLYWLVNVVRPHVNRYVHNKQQRPDAEQEGFLALRKAFDTFNPTKGLQFYGWAFYWTRDYVQKFLRRDYAIRCPRKRERPKQEKELLEEPSILETTAESADFIRYIEGHIDRLPVKPRTRDMLRMKLFDELNYEQIGAKYGLTRSAVSLAMIPALQLLQERI